jgi:Icc-related predicted phosphoesterase
MDSGVLFFKGFFMSLRIQIISDLHLEFHPDGGRCLLSTMDFQSSDVLLVAGDLCSAKTIARSFELLCGVYRGPIIYVPGNHEYYGSSFSKVDALLAATEQAHPNLSVLNNKTMEVAGRRILGTTLWFPDQPSNYRYEDMLNDFRMIRGFKEGVYVAHTQARQFLGSELRAGDVVVTHHLPSAESVSARHKKSPLNRFFVSPLDELILQRQPALWVHGHTHDSADYHLGHTRVVCNPFGYLGHELNVGWDAQKVVEVNA